MRSYSYKSYSFLQKWAHGGENYRGLSFWPFHGPVLPDSLLPVLFGHSLSLLAEALREPIVHYSQVHKPTAPGIAGYLPASKIPHCFLETFFGEYRVYIKAL